MDTADFRPTKIGVFPQYGILVPFFHIIGVIFFPSGPWGTNFAAKSKIENRWNIIFPDFRTVSGIIGMVWPSAITEARA